MPILARICYDYSKSMKNTLFKQITANINDYLLLSLSLMAIFGASIYYLYSLNVLGLVLSFLLTIVGFIILVKLLAKKANDGNKLTWNRKEYLFPIVYLVLFVLSIAFLITHQSSRALISPWDIVGGEFFLIYGVASLWLIITVTKKNIPTTIKIGLVSLHYFLSFVVAAIVYKIGYGFDPFVHQAAMELIDKNGIVTPKTPYYLGQYSLIIMLHKLTGVSIYFLNKFLVPSLTALFLPLATFRFLRYQSKDLFPMGKFISVIFLLVLSFSPFIMTTPQNLSYLFLALTIFMGLNGTNLLWTPLLALATLAIHPLAGIPALAWSAWLVFKMHKEKVGLIYRRLIATSIFLVPALLLPAALFITGANDFKGIKFGFNLLISPFKNIFVNISSAGREDFFLNFIYFFQSNLNLLIILIIIVGFIYFQKKKKLLTKNDLFIWRGLFLVNLSLFTAYVVSSQINFGELIVYEQSNYTGRILVMMIIFCLPCIVITLNSLIQKILQQEKSIRIIWLIFGAILLTTALYVSYPRFDKYFNSRGYSVSQNDLDTVNLINKNTTKPYIVLANQQVGVGALKELGFSHYYQTSAGLVYFYSIPTGGPLYEYYLEMVYKNPTKDTMINAMDLAGVDESYLVVNKYWHQSDRIIGEAKLVANDFMVIDDETYIFQYLR